MRRAGSRAAAAIAAAIAAEGIITNPATPATAPDCSNWFTSLFNSQCPTDCTQWYNTFNSACGGNLTPLLIGAALIIGVMFLLPGRKR